MKDFWLGIVMGAAGMLVLIIMALFFKVIVVESAETLKWRGYSDTEWVTVYGSVSAINELCRQYTKKPPPRSRIIAGCFIAHDKIIACSSLEICLHEAVHAADREWSHIPKKKPIFRPEDE